MPRKKYRFSTIADFYKDALDNKVPVDEVEKIIESIRYGIGLQKRDRELARFMQDGAGSFQDDPVFQKGFCAGYEQAQDDHKTGLDILQVGFEQADIVTKVNRETGYLETNVKLKVTDGN